MFRVQFLGEAPKLAEMGSFEGAGFGGEGVRTHALTPKSGHLQQQFLKNPQFNMQPRGDFAI